MNNLGALSIKNAKYYMNLAKEYGNPNKYFDDVFEEYGFEDIDNSHRLYLPVANDDEVATKNVESAVYRAIQSYLKMNYEIEWDDDFPISHYIQGYFEQKKDGKTQKVKIGKFLQKKGELELLKRFNEDSTRSLSKSGKSRKMAVISRHPYDIAGMSTDRGWNSCMTAGQNRIHTAKKSDIDKVKIEIINENKAVFKYDGLHDLALEVTDLQSLFEKTVLKDYGTEKFVEAIDIVFNNYGNYFMNSSNLHYKINKDTFIEIWNRNIKYEQITYYGNEIRAVYLTTDIAEKYLGVVKLIIRQHDINALSYEITNDSSNKSLKEALQLEQIESKVNGLQIEDCVNFIIHYLTEWFIESKYNDSAINKKKMRNKAIITNGKTGFYDLNENFIHKNKLFKSSQSVLETINKSLEIYFRHYSRSYFLNYFPIYFESKDNTTVIKLSDSPSSENKDVYFVNIPNRLKPINKKDWTNVLSTILTERETSNRIYETWLNQLGKANGYNFQPGGCNVHYIDKDLKHPQLIAYFIDEDDRNIEHPLGRVLIRPFYLANRGIFFSMPYELDFSKKQYRYRTYGTVSKEFLKTVNKFISESLNYGVENGTYTLPNELYDDGVSELHVIDSNDIVQVKNGDNGYNMVLTLNDNLSGLLSGIDHKRSVLMGLLR